MAGFLKQVGQLAGSLAGSQIHSNYTVTQPNAAEMGLWKVHHAKNANGRAVSIFEYDKTGAKKQAGRSSDAAVVECLKKESVRHHIPSVTLKRPPALEETRSALIFAVEPVQCSLREAIAASGDSRRRAYGRHKQAQIELDEVEMQKGFLQVCKALQFLHDSARAVHGNLTTDAVVINSKGDWKLSALAFLQSPSSSSPDLLEPDASLPLYVQRNLDYAAPELVMGSEQPSPASDMWSLGCVAHALISKTGKSPISSNSRISTYKREISVLERLRSSWSKYGSESSDLLNSLLLVSPSQRATSANLPQSCSWFSSILVSTLRFLDRDHFPSKTTPEQISFLKGLRTVLPRFSDKVRRKRILPALLEQGLGKGMRKELIPSLLPNIIFISQDLSQGEFRTEIWPYFRQLFAVAPNDSPENALALLEHLPTLQDKCDPTMFREDLPTLVLTLLSSTHAPLLIKTLQTIPLLCKSDPKDARDSSDDRATHALEFTTVRDTVFPKVAEVFTRTTTLGVKVAGLFCFSGMVAVLDKYTLQEKLCPLLAKIKTKDPNVLNATLNVFSLLGQRLTDPIVLSTLILPQLWTMSAAPLLNEEQFSRFMALIDALTRTVREERGKELKAASRITKEEEPQVQNLTWEELVRGNETRTAAARNGTNGGHSSDGFLTPDESKWSAGFSTPALSPSPAPLPASNAALNPTPAVKHPVLGARPVPAASFSFPSSTMDVLQPSAPALAPASSSNLSSWSSSQATPSSFASQAAGSHSGANYNVSLPTSNLQPSFSQLALSSQTAPALPPVIQPQQASWATASAGGSHPWSAPAPNTSSPSSFAVMQPTKVAPPPASSNAWKDLDPLG